MKKKAEELMIWKDLDPATFAAKIEAGSAVIVICRQKKSAFEAYTAGDLFEQSKAYLTTKMLRFGEASFGILCHFSQEGQHPLERRWLLNEARSRLAALSMTKRCVVYLEEGCDSADVVAAEDFYFSQLDPVEATTTWQSFSIVNHPKNKNLERHRDIRQQHQLGFRAWINRNPDETTSTWIASELKAFAKAHACKFRVVEKDELKKLGMNLLLAVGQASELSPSRLILVEYNLKKNQAPVLLVGKGITFDTGGINLKAFENFVNCMKNDMGGAALMAHLFMALVKSGYEGPLVLAIPACENLIGEGAMKPGVVVTSYKGKRVVVEHTDAEGRLILADAVAYANDFYQPRLTFTAATLTTAALRQFSGYFTPVHFLDPKWQANLHAAGERWGERFVCWDAFLPFAEGNRTKMADLTNMGRLPSHASMGGGSNVAAHFLKEFCDSPLIHFDIFATTWNWSGDYPGARYGATGAPFNSLFDFLRGF